MKRRNLSQTNYNAILAHLFQRIHETGEQMKNDFPNILRTAIETEAWKHFTDSNGRPYTNLTDWLHGTWPNGPGMGQGKHAINYEDTLQLTIGAEDVWDVLSKNAPRRTPS